MRGVSFYLSEARSQCLVAIDTSDLVPKPAISPDIAVGDCYVVPIHTGVFTVKRMAAGFMQCFSASDSRPCRIVHNGYFYE